MTNNRTKLPYRWFFLILAIGGLLASGIYIGIISVRGISILDIIRAIGYGVFGILMLWGAFVKRYASSDY